MNIRKKKKIEKLQGILTPQLSHDIDSEQDVLNLFNELGKDVSIDELKAYMLSQRQQAARLEEQSEGKKKENPFSRLSTDDIVELTEHRNKIIAQGARLELARRNFFYFCHLSNPDFFKPDRAFLVRLCNEMQSFYESDELVLIVNLPPRHGKSYTAAHFEKWVFGRNPRAKIMTGSYNETLSTNFSKAVRNGIGEMKADPNKIVYNDIFPDIHIQRGDGAINQNK